MNHAGPAPEPAEAAPSPSSGPRDGDGRPLTTDQIFHLLSASRRRQVLSYLRGAGGRATVGTLAEHVAAVELDLPVGQISSGQRKRIYIALYQVHLPALADSGVVAYDQERGTVELTEAADRLFPYLDLERGPDDPGPRGPKHRIAAWVRAIRTWLRG